MEEADKWKANKYFCLHFPWQVGPCQRRKELPKTRKKRQTQSIQAQSLFHHRVASYFIDQNFKWMQKKKKKNNWEEASHYMHLIAEIESAQTRKLRKSTLTTIISGTQNLWTLHHQIETGEQTTLPIQKKNKTREQTTLPTIYHKILSGITNGNWNALITIWFTRTNCPNWSTKLSECLHGSLMIPLFFTLHRGNHIPK